MTDFINKLFNHLECWWFNKHLFICMFDKTGEFKRFCTRCGKVEND